MASDDWNAPLGRTPPSVGRRRSFAIWGLAGLVVAGIAGLAAVLASADPGGGQPVATAAIPPVRLARVEASPPAVRPDPMPPAAPASAKLTSTPAFSTPTIENGVSVVRAASADAAKDRTTGGPLVINVPQALGRSEIAPLDKRLVEQGRYGPLPKIAADGTRPSEAYARPVVFSRAAWLGAPRVAIAVTVPVGDAGALAAAIALPPEVTLALLPDASTSLDAAALRSKDAGHEILLRLPAGDIADAPPHALRAAASPREAIDDLSWLLSRTTGYVGVAAPEAILGPDAPAAATVLHEIDARGLMLLRDRTASTGAPAGVAAGRGSSRADIVLDAAADPAALNDAFAALAAIARAGGSAIGVTGAAPATLAAIAAFARAAEDKGLALVPVSALAAGTGPSVAAAP